MSDFPMPTAINHRREAERFLRTKGVAPSTPHMTIIGGDHSMAIEWDAVAETGDGLWIVEVEPIDTKVEHVRQHVTNLALVAAQGRNIKELAWVLASESPRCHENVASIARPWHLALSALSKTPIPEMKYYDLLGRDLH